jgi:hypothetical protein
MRIRLRIARTIALVGLVVLLGAGASRAEQLGWIDAGYWANGQFNVTGWACDRGSRSPVWVALTNPSTGSVLAWGYASSPSEPAVAGVCGAAGATTLRYTVAITGGQEESVSNRPIQLKVRSNYYPYALRLALNSGTLTYPDNAIRGVIDNAPWDGGQVMLNGWACARGIAQSVAVHIYAGGPAGSGSWVTAGVANLWSEPAVLQACGVGSGAYRFSIPIQFGPAEMMRLGGQKLYVHGISPVGGYNRLIDNSGVVSLPGAQATANGGCGYVPAGWNAPYGSAVLSRSNGGPIRPVIIAIGEYYTHSMLSLGTAGIVHAEMKTPAQSSWPTVCTRPLDVNQLQYGYPGVTQINLGGAYADLQEEEITPVYLWGDPARAAAIANWIVNAPQVGAQSQYDGTVSLSRKLRNGAPVPYSLYQYRNIEQTNEAASTSSNNGMVCSTFLSWVHLQGGAGYVSAHTYDHALIANAANALFGTVQAACNTGVGFWSGLLRSVSCPFYDVCENAADQVTNCMSANACGSNDNTIWHGVRDDPFTTASSVSPDRLAGLPPHGVGTTTWSYDQGYHPIAWNAPGAQYGCWY